MTSTLPLQIPGAVAAVPSARAIVEVCGLTKRYRVQRGWAELLRHPLQREWTTVLDQVECRVYPGEFFGLLGPNGAGKTTLFKILSTLVEPDVGTALVGGHDIVREPHAVRTTLTPVVSDERSLNWRLSARENLLLFGALYGLRGSALRRRVEETLEVVELSDTGQKFVGRFSSGMRQRLLIARALLGEPKVLLLDEPTRSLDPISARRLRDFLRTQIVGARRCTVLLATHNAEEAFEVCDRVAILSRGRLVAVGRAAELARECSEHRYRLVSRDGSQAELRRLAEQQSIPGIRFLEPDSDGWIAVELTVPEGAHGCADLVRALVAAGVPVARLEQIPVSLADLIETIVHRAQSEAPYV
jgi:ABC-2 type transport system ATP-binding protein